jgi:hypothetical protein
MNVVFHTADENGRAIELFGNATEIRMKRLTRGFVAQERATVFRGRRDECKRRKGTGAYVPSLCPNWALFANPKGIAPTSPRLACNAYLGYMFGNGRNRVAVGNIGWTMTQGSAGRPSGPDPRNPGLWDGIPLGFSDRALAPQQQQDIPRVMKIAKKFGLEFLPLPGA